MNESVCQCVFACIMLVYSTHSVYVRAHRPLSQAVERLYRLLLYSPHSYVRSLMYIYICIHKTAAATAKITGGQLVWESNYRSFPTSCEYHGRGIKAGRRAVVELFWVQLSFSQHTLNEETKKYFISYAFNNFCLTLEFFRSKFFFKRANKNTNKFLFEFWLKQFCYWWYKRQISVKK